MPTTGQQIYRIFQQNVDKSFTNWTGVAAANRWFKSAYLKVVNDIYSERLFNQRAFDQIGYLISLNTVFNVNQTTNTVAYSNLPISSITVVGNTATVTTEVPHGLQNTDTVTIADVQGLTNINGVSVSVTVSTSFVFTATYAAPVGVHIANTGYVTPSTAINDYLHYLYGEATFVAPYYNLKVLEATNSSPIRLRLNKRNKIKTGDKVVVAGITGNTNANGEYYVKELNPSIGEDLWNLALYTDVNLQTPVAGNAASTSQGTISIVTEAKGMKLWLSDQKGALYGQPTVYEPYFQQGKLLLTIYPTNIPCRTVKLDYIRRMPREIDAADNVYDYERNYNYGFLEKIAVEAGRLLSVAVRDGSLNAGLTNEILENN